MSGEDKVYIAWVRRQPCAACLGPGPCEPHHSTNGSTLSDSPKAIGGRRGKGQRAHDHESLPLHMRCHRQFHDLKGPFEGWDKAFIREWQDAQVAEHRARYEAELERNPPPALPGAPKRKPTGDAGRERAAILDLVRDYGAGRHLTPDAHAAACDIAELIEARTETERTRTP
jgi:hypothetical protein